MDYKYTVLVLVVVGAILVGLGAAMGPETRDVDLSAVVEPATAVPASRAC